MKFHRSLDPVALIVDLTREHFPFPLVSQEQEEGLAILNRVNGYLFSQRCPNDHTFRNYEQGRQKPHACPYQREINDDRETLCECCDGCELNCRDNI